MTAIFTYNLEREQNLRLNLLVFEVSPYWLYLVLVLCSKMNEEAIRKRLKSLDLSQEGIETVSLWCMHHKDNCDDITSVWIALFRTGG